MANNKDQTNYVKGNSVFLYDSLNQETCADLIGELTELVMSKVKKHQQLLDINVKTMETPYDISGSNVIDIFINSPGGDVSYKNSIMALLNIARAKGAIIRTTVTGYAASSASQIAIQGTHGFRIMYQETYNLIHYGRSCDTATADGEAERIYKQEKRRRQNMFNTYKKFTSLTDKEIAECMKAEKHYFSAKECLNKNMCDWILTDTGIYLSRKDKQR